MQVAGIEEYAYTSSKAAVIHLTKQMAGYLAKRHITVNTISPGHSSHMELMSSCRPPLQITLVLR